MNENCIYNRTTHCALLGFKPKAGACTNCLACKEKKTDD